MAQRVQRRSQTLIRIERQRRRSAIRKTSLLALAEGLRDLDGVMAHLRDSGFDQRRVGRVARALMPFAAAVGRDGAPTPTLDTEAPLPGPEGGPSGYRRP